MTGPGENYTTVVGEDTCALGQAFAETINTEVGSGKIALLGGTPGNPLSASWQKCEKEALNPEIKVVGTYDTSWVASQVQEVVASLLASHPDLKGISYEYSGGMALGAFPAFEAAGVSPDQVWTMRTDEPVLGCEANELERPESPDLLCERCRELADSNGSDGGHDEAQGLRPADGDRVPDRDGVPGHEGPVRPGPTERGVDQLADSG